MLEIPSRQALAQLTAATSAIAVPITLGFARAIDDTRVSILYATPMGVGEYVLPVNEVPELVRPSTEGLGHADLAALQANPQGVFEWHLRFGEVQRAVSFRINGCEPATRFWIGVVNPDPF